MDELEQDLELQPTDPIEQTEEVGEIAETVEGVEKPAVKAPAEEGKKVRFSDEQQQVIDYELGRKVAEKRKLERENEDLRKKLEALEAPQKQASVVVPELPDPYTVSDAEYRQAVQDRDNALKQSVIVNQHNQWLQEQQQEAEQEKARVAHEELEAKKAVYRERATSLGVKTEDLIASGTKVAEFGISKGLADLILDDDEGPLLVKYLSQNVQELDRLVRLSPEAGAVRLMTQVKRDAAKLKPKQTEAPDPIEGVSSGLAIASRSGRSKIIDIY